MSTERVSDEFLRSVRIGEGPVYYMARELIALRAAGREGVWVPREPTQQWFDDTANEHGISDFEVRKAHRWMTVPVKRRAVK